MRAIRFVLIASAAFGGPALAESAGTPAGSGPDKTEVAPIHFDLGARKAVRRETLPTAATLGDLTYAGENKSEATPATKVAAKPPPRPTPKAAPRIARKVVAAAKPAKGPWMSEWRRAYIAKHGHQPPVPPR